MYLPRLIFIMLINNSKKPAKVLLFLICARKKNLPPRPWRHRRGFDKLSTIYSLLSQKIFKAQICKVQKITAPMHTATLETTAKVR